MFAFIRAGALIGALISAGAAFGDDAVPNGTKELEGKWKIISGVSNGKTLPERSGLGAYIVFQADQATGIDKDGKHKTLEFRVKKTLSPHQLDFLRDGKVWMQGIYGFKGKELLIGFSTPGNPRPKDLDSAKQDPRMALFRLIPAEPAKKHKQEDKDQRPEQ